VRWLGFLALFVAGVLATGAQKQEDILVSFAGTLKTINSKEISVEPEEGNDIRFLRTRRTKFLDARGKAVGDLEFKIGDPVTIEAYQKLNTELEAVRVRHTVKPETP